MSPHLGGGPGFPLPGPPAPAPPPQAPWPGPSSRAEASDGKTILVDTRGGPSGTVVGVLVAIDGPLQNRAFPVFDGDNTAGRAPQCRIHLESDYVSREHALIVHAHGGFGVKPLKADNPIYVNEQKVEQGAMLSDGDLLRLGKTTLKFRTV